MAKDGTSDDVKVLIERLCTQAGILIEDASVIALVRAQSVDELAVKVQQCRSAVQKMRQILNAADALLN